jgi:hypothetical protein
MSPALTGRLVHPRKSLIALLATSVLAFVGHVAVVPETATAAPATLWTNAEAFGPEAVASGPGYSQDVRVVDLGGGSAMAVFRSREAGYTAMKSAVRDASGAWSSAGFVGAANGSSWSTSVNAGHSPGFDIAVLSDGSVLLVVQTYDTNFNKGMVWVRYASGSWSGSLAQVDVSAGTNWGDCDGECLIALPNGKALLAMSDSSADDMTYTAFDGTASGGAGAWGSRVVSPYVVNVDDDNVNALALGADGRVYIAFSANSGSLTPSVTRVDPATLIDDTPVNLSTQSSFSSEPPALVIPPGTSDAMVAWKENNQAYVSQYDDAQSFNSGWSAKAALPTGSGRIYDFPSLAALPDGRVAAIVARETAPNNNNYRSVQVMITTGAASGGGPWPSSWTVLGDVSDVITGGSVSDRMSLVASGDGLVGVAAVDGGGTAPSGILGFGWNGSTGEWSGLTSLSTSAAQYFTGSFQGGVGTALAAWQGVPITAWQTGALNVNPTVFGLVSTASVIPVTPVPPPPPVYPPSAPRDVTAVGGDRSAVVSWREPETSGSFPVSNYKVTATPGGASCLTALLSCTVSGLTNGTAYTFRVEALNGAGWSPASSASAPVTPGGVTPAPDAQPLPAPVEPGGSVLQVNGMVDPNVTVEPKPSDKGLDITGDGWTMDLDGLGPDGKPLNLSPTGALRLANERDVATEGTGFLPNSEVDLYVDPPVLVQGAAARSARGAEAIYVGTVRTDARGNFAGTATLPEAIVPGDHVLQAVGYSPQRQSRALSLGVIVDPWIVLDQGTRKADGRHDRIRTTGTSGGIDAGTRLTPFIRYSGQQSFSQGKATITVQSDGTFRWTRQIKKGKGLTCYVAWTDVESNKVFWAKIS